ncbi:MAG TPA: DoxX family protein [Polyangiaceae bacterium]|nr:DoxX family protein [Polyangiaceae bacterium]
MNSLLEEARLGRRQAWAARVVAAARLVLGFIFALFGLSGFLHFLTMPSPTGAAAAFFGGLAATGYFFPLLSATELTAGILLLAGRFVTLALTVLAPIIVNIVAFHLAFEPSGLPVAVLVLALESFLAWRHRDAFSAMLRFRALPVNDRARVDVPSAPAPSRTITPIPSRASLSEELTRRAA